MAYCEIPLTCLPYSTQTFKMTLEDGKRNVNIRLHLRYDDLCGVWQAAIYDNTSGKLLVDCMPLVCGINLLEQYKYLKLGEAYIRPVEKTTLDMPDNQTLGKKFILIWGDSS